VKFVYCTKLLPESTGLDAFCSAKAKLLEIVKRFGREHRVLILEDAAYRELRYDGPALPSIKSTTVITGW